MSIKTGLLVAAGIGVTVWMLQPPSTEENARKLAEDKEQCRLWARQSVDERNQEIVSLGGVMPRDEIRRSFAASYSTCIEVSKRY